LSVAEGGYGRSNVSDLDHAFAITEAVEGTVHVLAIAGQADLHTAPDLRAAITATVDGGARQLVIDLSETTFIDSMTLGVLLGALKRLSPLDGRLAIACPSRNLRRIFEITSLDEVLRIADTTADAVALVQAGDMP
jgi:anti-sigma B factor antagonist